MKNLKITYRHLTLVFEKFLWLEMDVIKTRKEIAKPIRTNIKVEAKMYDLYKVVDAYILMPQTYVDTAGSVETIVLEKSLLSYSEPSAKQLKLQEENPDYIIPTKTSPTFTAHCDYFGYIELPTYKNTLVNNCTISTFATSYASAIERLHEWIKENEWSLREHPKATYEISAIDGRVDKYGDAIRVKVYSISTAKAIKYLF